MVPGERRGRRPARAGAAGGLRLLLQRPDRARPGWARRASIREHRPRHGGRRRLGHAAPPRRALARETDLVLLGCRRRLPCARRWGIGGAPPVGARCPDDNARPRLGRLAVLRPDHRRPVRAGLPVECRRACVCPRRHTRHAVHVDAGAGAGRRRAAGAPGPAARRVGLSGRLRRRTRSGRAGKGPGRRRARRRQHGDRRAADQTGRACVAAGGTLGTGQLRHRRASVVRPVRLAEPGVLTDLLCVPQRPAIPGARLPARTAVLVFRAGTTAGSRPLDRRDRCDRPGSGDEADRPGMDRVALDLLCQLGVVPRGLLQLLAVEAPRLRAAGRPGCRAATGTRAGSSSPW